MPQDQKDDVKDDQVQDIENNQSKEGDQADNSEEKGNEAKGDTEKSGSILTDDKNQESKGDENSSPVPEKYEFTLPEGLTLSDEQKEMFAIQAKEMGLSQEQANKMLEISQQNTAAYQEAHKAQVQEWEKGLKADKNFEADLAFAQSAMAKFDEDGELKQILDETGYGSHPAIFKIFAKLGRTHAEDKLIDGDSVKNETPRHERLYGKYNNL